MTKLSKITALFASLLLLLPAFAAGQATNARITGDVRDDEGIFLAGVTVTAVNVANRAETVVISDGNGAFRFLALAPGIYQVSFDLEGYKSFVASGIQLSADQSATVRGRLEILLGPDGQPLVARAAPPQAQAARPAAGLGKTWQLEIATGVIFAEPGDLNGIVAYDRWLSKQQALHYMLSPDFWSLNLEGVSTGALQTLSGAKPLTARARFFLGKTISLALGVGYFDHRRVSAYTRTFDLSHGSVGSVGTQEKFLVVHEFPDYRLSARGLFPHAGAQASLYVGRNMRMVAFAHAGWTFAECVIASTHRFMDGWTHQDLTTDAVLNGKGDGFAMEGGCKIEVAVGGGLGLFLEGLIQSCRIKNVTGDRVASETVNDAAAANAGSRTTQTSRGPWVMAGVGIAYPTILAPGDVTPFQPFTLDLGGPGMRAGVFFRF